MQNTEANRSAETKVPRWVTAKPAWMTTEPENVEVVPAAAYDEAAKYMGWYKAIAPRLSNFANRPLPGDVIQRGVRVLNDLREWKERNASLASASLAMNPDDLACFLMCVDQFWKAHNVADLTARLRRNEEPW